MKRYLKTLLFVFPIFYLLLGFYFRQIFGDLSLRSTDPDYIQFLSGMCISTGQFGQANIDHPGSAMQMLLALIFRIVYLFRSHSVPFFEDAMLNSDMYLSIANLVISFAIAITLYWAGSEILRITKNYFYALAVQTGPFIINIWYEIIGRIYPELFFVIPISILSVQFFREMYRESGKQQDFQDVWMYSLTIALGMALKMTFLPFVFIPLIVLKSVRHKLQFAGISSTIFLIVTLPITFQMKVF